MDELCSKKIAKQVSGNCSDRELDRRIAKGDFPKPIYPYSPFKPYWFKSVLEEHLKSLAKKTRPALPATEIVRRERIKAFPRKAGKILKQTKITAKQAPTRRGRPRKTAAEFSEAAE
jgi:hypothetical protein